MKVLNLPADAVVSGTKEALERAAKLEDPIDRAQALKLAGNVLADAQLQLREARALAINEAVQARSVGSVALELGITRGRLYQLLKEIEVS